MRATPPRGDFTDPRIGASGVDARTRESGRERKDAPGASGSMFLRPPRMNKRVDRSRSTRFGNSPIETDPNFRWLSERTRAGEGRFLRTLRAGVPIRMGGNAAEAAEPRMSSQGRQVGGCGDLRGSVRLSRAALNQACPIPWTMPIKRDLTAIRMGI